MQLLAGLPYFSSGQTAMAALTGRGQQEDRRRTAAAGFNHHLVKPPELKVVDALLAGLVARAATERGE